MKQEKEQNKEENKKAKHGHPVVSAILTAIITGGLVFTASYLVLQSWMPDRVQNLVSPTDHVKSLLFSKKEEEETEVMQPYEETVAVPDITGRTEAQAREAANKLSLGVKFKSEKVSNTKEGIIIEQEPAAGTMVTPNTTIFYTTSIGAELSIVPDVGGMNVAEAVDVLKAKGFHNVLIHTERVNEEAFGTVYLCDPSPGEKANTSAHITLTVASGSLTQNVAVADYLGANPEEAAESAEKSFLLPLYEYGYSDIAEPDVIIRQSEQRGELITAGSLIYLTINQGETPKAKTTYTVSLSQPDTIIGSDYVIVLEQTLEDGAYAEKKIASGTAPEFPIEVTVQDMVGDGSGTLRYYEMIDGSMIPRAYYTLED